MVGKGVGGSWDWSVWCCSWKLGLCKELECGSAMVVDWWSSGAYSCGEIGFGKDDEADRPRIHFQGFFKIAEVYWSWGSLGQVLRRRRRRRMSEWAWLGRSAMEKKMKMCMWTWGLRFCRRTSIFLCRWWVLSKLSLWQKSRPDDMGLGKNKPIRMRVTKLCLSEFDRGHVSNEDLIFDSSQLMIVLISTDACEVCRMPEVWRRGLSPGWLNNL